MIQTILIDEASENAEFSEKTAVSSHTAAVIALATKKKKGKEMKKSVQKLGLFSSNKCRQ